MLLAEEILSSPTEGHRTLAPGVVVRIHGEGSTQEEGCTPPRLKLSPGRSESLSSSTSSLRCAEGDCRHLP